MLEDESLDKRPGIRTFAQNRLVRILAAMTVLYWLFPAFGTPGNILIEIMTMILIGVLVVVIYRWGVAAFFELQAGGYGGRSQLMVGVVSFALSTVGILIWTIIWRWMEYPDWMRDHPALGFMRLWSVIGAGLMITSPGAVSGGIPPKNWGWLVLAAAIAAGLLGFTLGAVYRPAALAVPSTLLLAEGDSSVCAADKPFWVSESRIIHGPLSPFRAQVTRPIACFRTERAALANGYQRLR